MTDVAGRRVLKVAALGFFAFGVWALVAPATMLNLVGVSLGTAAAGAEARAYYGGLEVGFGAYLWWSASTTYARGAALAACSIYAGCVGGRIFGMLVERSFNTYVALSGLGEFSGAVATWWAHRRL